jgi:hypothetical protein
MLLLGMCLKVVARSGELGVFLGARGFCCILQGLIVNYEEEGSHICLNIKFCEYAFHIIESLSRCF